MNLNCVVYVVNIHLNSVYKFIHQACKTSFIVYSMFANTDKSLFIDLVIHVVNRCFFLLDIFKFMC